MSGWTLPTVRERVRQPQAVELPWYMNVYRFLAHAFARPVLDHRGRPRR